jgi:hypothetical protein
MELIADRRCICLTATPSKSDKDDTEKRIIDIFEFQILRAYKSADYKVNKSCLQLVVDVNTIPCMEVRATDPSDYTQMSKLVCDERVKTPVLLFCDDSLKEFLVDARVNFYAMNATADSIDE